MTTEQPIVEPLAGPEDLEEILAVDRESFLRPWTRAMYEAELRNPAVSRIYVIRAPGARVAGYCAVWMVDGELHINNLAIRPAFRRRGLATTLLREVLREAAARGCVRATLEVRRSNHPARRLYEALGFRLRGVRRGYYTDPVDDALVLWRDPAQPVEAA
ncbi:MAG TPA: ribosomal protein S18-alanine N-acetyltransferase [Vicinamibacterales bacterium]